jgi:hypothetical protein
MRKLPCGQFLKSLIVKIYNKYNSWRGLNQVTKLIPTNLLNLTNSTLICLCMYTGCGAFLRSSLGSILLRIC